MQVMQWCKKVSCLVKSLVKDWSAIDMWNLKERGLLLKWWTLYWISNPRDNFQHTGGSFLRPINFWSKIEEPLFLHWWHGVYEYNKNSMDMFWNGRISPVVLPILQVTTLNSRSSFLLSWTLLMAAITSSFLSCKLISWSWLFSFFHPEHCRRTKLSDLAVKKV